MTLPMYICIGAAGRVITLWALVVACVGTMIGVLTNDVDACLCLFRILIPAIVLGIAATIYSFSARNHRYLVLSPDAISVDIPLWVGSAPQAR
jgi:predicted MFS family arabinose efflux permease